MSAPVLTASRAVEVVAAALTAATEELCTLDSSAGDGDHGFAMAAAADGIRADLAQATPPDVASLVGRTAGHFAAVGGSMGALLGVALESLAAALAEPGRPLTSDEVVRYFGVVQDSLTEFGGAEPGDKTIVDAVAAARDAAGDAARSGMSPLDTLAAAALGARAGADATADMVARVGRASRLGERSRGHVDPGARSFAIIIDALAGAYRTGDRA